MFIYNRRHHPEVISLLATTYWFWVRSVTRQKSSTSLFGRRRLAPAARNNQGILVWINPPGGDAGEYSSKDERGCDARTRRSGSVSDWRASFPRTIFVVQRKSFILKLKLSTKYLFGCKNYCEFRRFFSPPKKPKNAGCFGKNAGMRKLPNLRDFPHDCGMVDTYVCADYRTFIPHPRYMNCTHCGR